MQALALSGGGAKGAFTAGVAYYLIKEQGLTFDLAVGTSTGSLVGGPALLGDVKYLRNIYTGVDTPDILKNSFLGKALSFLLGEAVPVQASMEPLRRKLLDYYIHHPDGSKIEELQKKKKTHVATSVNAHTGEITYVSSDDVITPTNPNPPNGIEPETFVNAILASASMPVFCKAVRVFELEAGHPNHNDLFWDGGVKEFIPVSEAVARGADTVYAIPTHIMKPNATTWGGTTDPDRTNLLKILKWVIDSALNEVEKGDMFRAYAFNRVGASRESVEKLAAAANLPKAKINKLTKVIDDIFPNFGDRLVKLYAIPPTEELGGDSLAFDDADMTRLFALGRKAARLFSGEAEKDRLFAEMDARAMGLV